jgi:hypothetical protein
MYREKTQDFSACNTVPQTIMLPRLLNFFLFLLDFQIYLQSVYIHSNTISKLFVEKRGLVEECSVATLRDKKVKTLCRCRGKRVQTKENAN